MNANIYHKHKDIIITNLLLPLGHISNISNIHMQSIVSWDQRTSKQGMQDINPSIDLASIARVLTSKQTRRS